MVTPTEKEKKKNELWLARLRQGEKVAFRSDVFTQFTVKALCGANSFDENVILGRKALQTAREPDERTHARLHTLSIGAR